MKKANCGASVPASKTVKMAMGGMVRKAAKAAATSGKDKRQAMKGSDKGSEKGSKKSYKDE